MKDYIVNNRDRDNILYSENDNIKEQLSQIENNLKFIDVYLRKTITSVDKHSTLLSDHETIFNNELTNLNNKYDKLKKWVSLPWWKRIFISQKKFFEL